MFQTTSQYMDVAMAQQSSDDYSTPQPLNPSPSSCHQPEVSSLQGGSQSWLCHRRALPHQQTCWKRRFQWIPWQKFKWVKEKKGPWRAGSPHLVKWLVSCNLSHNGTNPTYPTQLLVIVAVNHPTYDSRNFPKKIEDQQLRGM